MPMLVPEQLQSFYELWVYYITITHIHLSSTCCHTPKIYLACDDHTPYSLTVFMVCNNYTPDILLTARSEKTYFLTFQRQVFIKHLVVKFIDIYNVTDNLVCEIMFSLGTFYVCYFHFQQIAKLSNCMLL